MNINYHADKWNENNITAKHMIMQLSHLSHGLKFRVKLYYVLHQCQFKAPL